MPMETTIIAILEYHAMLVKAGIATEGHGLLVNDSQMLKCSLPNLGHEPLISIT